MLMLLPGSRVLVATDCVGGRNGIDGMSALVTRICVRPPNACGTVCVDDIRVE